MSPPLPLAQRLLSYVHRDADSSNNPSTPTPLSPTSDPSLNNELIPGRNYRPRPPYKKRLTATRRSSVDRLAQTFLDNRGAQTTSTTGLSDNNLSNLPLDTSFLSNLDVPVQPPETSCHPDYSFLQAPDTKNLLPQDLAFLTSQGCFVVPHRAALDEFMRQYFMHVHPMLPILDESDHWLSYNSREGEGERKMSFLVLQGILFISSGVRSTHPSVKYPTHQSSSLFRLTLSRLWGSARSNKPSSPSIDEPRYLSAPVP